MKKLLFAALICLFPQLAYGQIPGIANTLIASGSYVANAVNFDGTNDWLTRGAGVGSTSSKLVTGSFWIKSAADGSNINVATFNTAAGFGGAIRFFITKTSANLINIVGRNSAASTILNVSTTTNSVEIADGWLNIKFSFDMANVANRFIYINNTSDLATVTTYTNDTMDFAGVGDVGIMGSTVVSNSADIADFAIWTGQFIDLSVTANRLKFISAANKPVMLGATGTLPGLGTPAIYFSGPTASWQTNKGSGGGFTLHGALTTATTHP